MPEKLVWLASILAYAVLLTRLVWLNLHRRYPLFSAYLLVCILGNLFLAWFPTHGRQWFEINLVLYAKCWAGNQAVQLAFRALVAFEIFQDASGHQVNFTNFGRRLRWLCLLIAAGVCTLPLPAEYYASSWGAPWLKTAFSIDQYLEALVLMFLGISRVFFVGLLQRWAQAIYYKPNLICIWTMMIGFGSVKMAMTLAAVLDRPHIHEYSFILLTVTTLVLLVCAKCLSLQGENWGRAMPSTQDERLSHERRWAAVRAILGR